MAAPTGPPPDWRAPRLNTEGRYYTSAGTPTPHESTAGPLVGEPAPVGLPELLDVDQAADALNTTPRHVRRLVSERRLAHFKVGRKVRISRAELVAWLDRNRVDAAS